MSVKELQNIISPKFTEQVLHKIIAKTNGLSEIKINKINMGASSKKGDSYLSTICRFTIEATGKNGKGQEETVFIPVITKFLPKNSARVKTYRSDEFFENEVKFFEVWAEFQKFQEEEKIMEKFDNIPTVLATHIDGTNDFVSMIDLAHAGYRSAERGAGLNYEHAVVILQVMAGFHAVSLAFKEKRPEKFEKMANSLNETYFSERLRPWYANFQQRVFTIYKDAVEKELPPEYLSKLNSLIDRDLYGLLIKSCIVRGPLAVITHGDVWVPNFLIKYEAAKPANVIMIDFQLSRYTTLVTDLAFFLYSCVDMDLVEKNWDDLVIEYHTALNVAQKKFHCKNFVTIDDLNKQLKEHSVMGVGMSMEALIMSQLEDDDVADLDGIQGTEAVPLETVWCVVPFKEQEKRKRIAKMIKLAADRNFI